MGLISESKRILRSRFVSGILVVVPLILTFVLLKALVDFIDSLVRPVLISLFGTTYDLPFAGVLITLALILLVGILTTNVIGHELIRLWDRQISKIPVVNFIYGSAKQLVQALSIPQRKSFKSVVLIEYPRRGAYMLAFLVNEISLRTDNKGEELRSVFIPSSPLPVSGFVALIPSSEIIFLDMTVEEGIRFLVSGSIISPSVFRPKITPGKNNIGDSGSNDIKAGPIDESR
jgi:uncharacterized membrane protein